jgi:hypothetical protein
MATGESDQPNWLVGPFDQHETSRDSEKDEDREPVYGFGNDQLCFLLQ